MSDINNQTIEEAFTHLEQSFKNLVETIKKEVTSTAILINRCKSYNTNTESVISYANNVLELVSDTLLVSKEDIVSKNRNRIIVDARHIYCFIIKKISIVEMSYGDAGIVINRDHATVIYSCKNAENLKITNKDFERKLTKCVNEFERKFEQATYNSFSNIPQY